jgi:hypothetical protein
MTEYLEIFERIKAGSGERYSGNGLNCSVGIYSGSPFLRLQKNHWTNGSAGNSGVFFSVWVEEKGLKKNRAFYNIHALKMRKLPGYTIVSRDFADDFRRMFESDRDSWPNVSTDYGPLTLMQGWIEINSSAFDSDVLRLMDRFENIDPMIDSLLKQRKTPDTVQEAKAVTTPALDAHCIARLILLIMAG